MAAVPITAHTRLFALLGDPVAHSLSPAFHNAALQHLRCDAVYVALRCDAATAPELLRGIARAGGGGNITIPHKAIAAAAIERATDVVHRTRACNTFWSEAGRICGDNTDVAGFRRALACLVPSASGASVLVIGAGGAAAAVLCALLEDGVARVTLHNRSVPRAEALAARLDPARRTLHVATAQSLTSERYDIIVNASSLGLHETDTLPVDLSLLQPPRAVLDLVYVRHATTRFVQLARQLGIVAADGIEMLLGQGAAAFERWFGIPAPLDVMRRALEAE